MTGILVFVWTFLFSSRRMGQTAGSALDDDVDHDQEECSGTHHQEEREGILTDDPPSHTGTQHDREIE